MRDFVKNHSYIPIFLHISSHKGYFIRSDANLLPTIQGETWKLFINYAMWKHKK